MKQMKHLICSLFALTLLWVGMTAHAASQGWFDQNYAFGKHSRVLLVTNEVRNPGENNFPAEFAITAKLGERLQKDKWSIIMPEQVANLLPAGRTPDAFLNLDAAQTQALTKQVDAVIVLNIHRFDRVEKELPAQSETIPVVEKEVLYDNSGKVIGRKERTRYVQRYTDAHQEELSRLMVDVYFIDLATHRTTGRYTYSVESRFGPNDLISEFTEKYRDRLHDARKKMKA